MKVGFIGLGNVGGKLARSLLRNGISVVAHDLNSDLEAEIAEMGAEIGAGPAAISDACDVIITSLPSPAASAAVMQGDGRDAGVLSQMRAGKIWLEMSTTAQQEVKRIGAMVLDLGGEAVDCPVSGGCHRAATGNISIFAGCTRATFEKVLPLLTLMGRRVLHTGELGSASVLKVVTNYLATANLISVCEALTVCGAAKMDLSTAFEAIRISSGNSFVHETESQVILNGSRDISFTMDLVLKDIGLFQEIADHSGVQLDLNPIMIDIFKQGIERYGQRELSPNIIKRLEERTGLDIRAPGFPAEMVDDEPEEQGYEVRVRRGSGA